MKRRQKTTPNSQQLKANTQQPTAKGQHPTAKGQRSRGQEVQGFNGQLTGKGSVLVTKCKELRE